MEAMADAGVCTPSVQDVAWVTSPRHPWQRTGRGVAVAAGDLVAFEAGVLLDGYAGELGRTVVAGGVERGGALFARRDELWARLFAACGPGEPLSGLLDAYADAGVDPPPTPIARGLGLGYDQPIVATELPRTAGAEVFEPGMVLAVTAYVWEPGVGAAYGQEPLVVDERGPRILTAAPFAPADDG